MPRVCDIDPTRVYLFPLAACNWGHKSFWKPTVANPTQPHSTTAIKHKAIFSLHACIVPLSFKPPIERNKNEGAQKVTSKEKRRQMSKPPPEALGGITPEPDWASVDGGFMRGTGATLLSGRVRVLARRIVVADAIGGLVVGIGTSEAL